MVTVSIAAFYGGYNYQYNRPLENPDTTSELVVPPNGTDRLEGNMTYGTIWNNQTQYEYNKTGMFQPRVYNQSSGNELCSVRTVPSNFTSCPQPPSGLKAYLPLDESGPKAYSHITNTHFKLWNSPSQGVAGQVENAYSFDGSNSHLNRSDVYGAYTGDFTVSAWFKTTDTDGSIVVEGTSRSSCDLRDWDLYFANGDLTAVIANSDDTCKVLGQHTGYDDGNWHHAVIAYDAGTGTGKFYIDGTEKNSVSLDTAGRGDTNTRVEVGGDSSSLGDGVRMLNADVDELRLYDRQLSSSEVAALYNLRTVLGPEEQRGGDPDLSLTVDEPRNTFYSTLKVWVNGSTNEASNVTYEFDSNGTVYTACENCSSFANSTLLSDGQHNVTVTATDFDNGSDVQTQTVTFTVDTTPPTVSNCLQEKSAVEWLGQDHFHPSKGHNNLSCDVSDNIDADTAWVEVSEDGTNFEPMKKFDGAVLRQVISTSPDGVAIDGISIREAVDLRWENVSRQDNLILVWGNTSGNEFYRANGTGPTSFTGPQSILTEADKLEDPHLFYETAADQPHLYNEETDGSGHGYVEIRDASKNVTVFGNKNTIGGDQWSLGIQFASPSVWRWKKWTMISGEEHNTTDSDLMVARGSGPRTFNDYRITAKVADYSDISKHINFQGNVWIDRTGTFHAYSNQKKASDGTFASRHMMTDNISQAYPSEPWDMSGFISHDVEILSGLFKTFNGMYVYGYNGNDQTKLHYWKLNGSLVQDPVAAGGESVTLKFYDPGAANDSSVTWKLCANDTAGNQQCSTTNSFTVKDGAEQNSGPSISNLAATPNPVNTGATVNVTADITDSNGVDSAKCTLKDADGNIEANNVSMSTTSSDTYYCEYTPSEEPSNIGSWTAEIHANDTESASSSDSTTFTVEDAGNPAASNLQDNQSGYIPVGSAFNISADVQDDGSGLDYAVLATNDSGTFRNHTEFEYNGQEYNLSNSTTGFTKGNDGNWYVADAANESVFEYYENWTWTGNRYSVSSEDSAPQDLIQESDGTWYVLGASNDNVYEYNSDWSYSGTSHSVVSTAWGPTGLAKGNDGHYYVMRQGGPVYEYNSTWDSQGSYDSPGVPAGTTEMNMYQDATDSWWVIANDETVYKHNSTWGYENVSYTLDRVRELGTSPSDLELSDGTWYVTEGDSTTVTEHISGRYGSPFQFLSVAEQQKTPWFEWQNSSVTKSFGYKVWVKDDAGNWNVTATGSQYIGDFTPPSFQNLQDNSSKAETQDTVNISADLSDSLSGLTEARLATNESGTFANKTPWSYTGNSYNLGSEHSFSYDTYYNGSHWWTVEPSTDKIHKYEPDWTYTGTNYSTAGETSDPRAILQLSNGNWLLLASTNENVYEYYPNWTYTGTSYDVSSEAGVSEDFVEDENGNFWVVKRTQTTADDGDYVYKYGSDWTYTGTKHSVTSEDTYPTGIAKTGKIWWIMGTDTNSVYRYDNQWTYTGSTYDVSSEDSDPRGFQQWNQSLWLIGDGGDNIYEYSVFLYQSPRLFDNAASGLSDHAWKNTSFNGLLGYKIYGKDRAGNWGVSATGTFISTRTPGYTNQKIIRHGIGGSNTRQLNLTIDDKGESDIAGHNSPPSGSEGLFTNSTLRIDGWTVGTFDWAATVSDQFSRTSSAFDVNFTMSDSRLQEDDYSHDLSTQQVNRTVGIENRGPNAADYDLTFKPEGTTVTNGNTTGTVSSGSTVETTGVWSGDWLTNTEYDFSPQRDEVTLGISYLGDRPFEVANSKAVQFTGVDITGGVTAPRGCSQTNNTAVDIGAAATENYSIEFSCDPGDVGDPGLVKTLDATDDNQTRYNYTTTELNITSNETRHTNVTWKIDKSELQDWDSRNNQSGSIDSNTTGVTVTDKPNTARVTFTTDCCSSSPAQGIHTASLVYYVGEEDTTTDSGDGGSGSGGSSGDDEDDDLGAELLPSTPYRVTPGMNVTETLTVRNYKNVENRVELTIDPRPADACQYVSIREVTKGRVDDAGRIAVNTSGGFGDSGLVRIPPASEGSLTGSSSEIPVQLQIRMPDQTTFERVKNENGSLSCRLSATVDRGTVNDVVLEIEPKINPFKWVFDLIGQFTDALLQTFSTTQQTCFGENNTALLTNETAECPETAQETRRMPNRAGAVLILTILGIGLTVLIYLYR